LSNRLIRPGRAGLLCLTALGAAQADGGRMMPSDMPKAYTAECAACHTAYAPGLLPARSWQRIMTGLDKHYGTDASLDDATVRQLSTWLQTHAGTYKRVNEAPPQDRLTRSAWFERKHDEIPSAVWKHASIKSAANCGACHTGADRGDFDDDHIRLPAGVSLGRRWPWND
jgi:mono/diheme cytochrome c family protein